MNSKILLFLRAVLLLLSIGMMSGCEEKDATIDVNYSNYLAIVEDIGGNQNGVSASAEQINSLIEVDGARENLDYSIGLILMGEYKYRYNIAAGEEKERYNISCVNTERPTPEEIQNAVNAVNLSADILIQIGNEADDTSTESVITIEQIRRIIPPVRNILENAVDLYRAYIDKYPDKFSSPATQPEVQAMIDAVNNGVDPVTSTVEADPVVVVADGEHFSTITVIVSSIRGVLLVDANVLLEQNGTSSIGGVRNNNDGSYEFTVTSDTVQSVAYEAIVNGIRVDASAEVNFTYDPNPDNWVVSLTPSTQDVIASAQRVIRGMIVAEVKDGVGHPVTGATGENMISLDQGNQVSHIYASENRGNGRYEIEVSSEVVSDVIYVAKVGETLHNESTARVRFTHDPDPSHWNILLSPAEQGVTISTPANESHGTVAIEVKDNEGNLVSGVSSRLALIGTNSQTSTIGQVSGDNGVYHASVSSDARKTVVYQAKIDAVLHNESSATVNYVTSTNPEDWDISLVANPAINLTADGETKSTITARVTVRGTNESVELAGLHISGGEPSTHSAVDFSNKDNGVYTFTVSSLKAEKVTYHVDAYNKDNDDGNTTESKDVAIVFVADKNASNWILNFTANPATVKANGEISTLRGILTDKNGNVINDADITITQNGQSNIGDGKLTNPNNDNIYTLEVNDTTPQNVTYTATTVYEGETYELNTTNVNFISVDVSISITATPSADVEVSECANGGSDITVTVTDGVSPITDSTVTLADNGQDSEIGNQVDNGSGVYTYHVCSKKAEDVTYTATATKDANSDASNTVVSYVSTISPSKWIVTLSPGEQNVTVGTNGIIIASVKDIYDNVINATTISLTADIGSSTFNTCTTDAQGECTITLSNTVAETVVYTPQADGNAPHADSNTATVNFNYSDASEWKVTLSPETQNITAGTDGAISVKVVDVNVPSINIANAVISLTADIGSSTFNTCTTDAQGECTITLSDTVAETVVYTPQADGNAPHADSNTATVNFVTGENIRVTEFTPETSNIKAGESVTMTIKTDDGIGNAKDPDNLDLITVIADVAVDTCVNVALGEHSCTVTSTKTGEYTLSTNVTGAPEQKTASLTVIPADSTEVTLDVDPEGTVVVVNDDEVVVGNNVPVIMTLTDGYGNLKDVPDANVSIVSSVTEANLTLENHTLGEYTYSLYDEKYEDVNISTNVAGAEDKNATVAFVPGELNAGKTEFFVPSDVKTFDALTIGIVPKDVFGNAIPLDRLVDSETLIVTTSSDDVTSDYITMEREVFANTIVGYRITSKRRGTIAVQLKYQELDIKEPVSYFVEYSFFVTSKRLNKITVGDETDNTTFDNSPTSSTVNFLLDHNSGEYRMEYKIYDNNVAEGEEINIGDIGNISIRFVDRDTQETYDDATVKNLTLDGAEGENYFRYELDFVENAGVGIDAKGSINIDGIEKPFSIQ